MSFLKLFLGGVFAVVTLMTAAHGQEKRTITIASAGGFGTASTSIAKEMGLFEKYGVEVKTPVMDSANAVTTALISRSIEVAASGIGEIIVAQGRGQKVVLVKNTYDGIAGVMILSKAVAEKSGVALNAPVEARAKALDGLVIATPSPSSSYTIVLKSLAATVGANIRFTYMAQPAMATALETGAIQGYMSGAPMWAPPVLSGTGVTWLSGPKKEFPLSGSFITAGGLHVMEDFAAANKDLMKSLIAVIDDFNKALVERPADVKAAIGRVYPALNSQTIDLVFTTEMNGFLTKPLTAADMKHDIDFMKSSGGDLPPLDRIDPGSLLYRAQ